MYRKAYQYTINAEDYHAWKVMVDEADELYREHGALQTNRTIQRTGNAMIVRETSVYESEEDFLRIMQELQNTERIQALSADFNEMTHGEVKELEV